MFDLLPTRHSSHTVAECYDHRLQRLWLAEKHVNRYREADNRTDRDANISIGIVFLFAALDGLDPPYYDEPPERMTAEGHDLGLRILREYRLSLCHVLDHEPIVGGPKTTQYPDGIKVTVTTWSSKLYNRKKEVVDPLRLSPAMDEGLADVVQAAITLFKESFNERLREAGGDQPCENSHGPPRR